ncbi:acetate--CoA ligase family protein, partial [Candidatus Microgenomates bacterium]|nr:acetate--CoA ligase family protein [Candidatus Microgenomates bacterium]
CLGFVNNLCPINATFGQQIKTNGNLRFISQSGALATGLFDWCDANGVGFSEFITLGNKAVVNENDCLEYFAATPGPIGLYLESISDGKRFFDLTAKLSKTNPIFIIKPGKTTAAAKAMQSHTGSIAGEDVVLQTALDQAGVIRCEELEEFFDLSRALSWSLAPIGPRVAIVSNAGGPAVISADAIVKFGLKLASFSQETHDQLNKILPRTASGANPVDVLGDALADRYVAASEIAIGNPETDALVCILTPQLMTQIEKTAEMIGDLSKKYQKPVFCSFIGGSLVSQGEQTLNSYKIPSFRFPERAISTLAKMWKWRQYYYKPEDFKCPANSFNFNLERSSEIINLATNESRGTLDNNEVNQLFLDAGINIPPAKIVSNFEEAINFSNDCGWPTVLKLCSPLLLHKTEVGGVIADINSPVEMESAWAKLETKVKEHLLPLDYEAAAKLVESSKIYPLLKGYRGEVPCALDKVYDVMVRLSHLALKLESVNEIEINPVIVTLNNVWAVDGKVVLKNGMTQNVNPPKFKMGTIKTHTNPGGNFHEFTIELDSPIKFLPGQYVSVKVADNRINAYSVASQIDEKTICLLVDISPGGVGSKFFAEVKVGDKISFLGPFGTFKYVADTTSEKDIFVATGSGISALRFMVEEALKISTKPIVLYWGLRFNNDVLWQNVFTDLAEKHPNFKFNLVLSKPDGSWAGLQGHVTDYLKVHFPDLSKNAVYSCGNKHFIIDATEVAKTCGCPPERIYSEKFF